MPGCRFHLGAPTRCELAAQTHRPPHTPGAAGFTPAQMPRHQPSTLSSRHPVGGAFLPLLFGHWGVDFLTEGCYSHCPILPSLIFPVHPVKAFTGVEQETQAGPLPQETD